ncbi:MAG: LptF/LptG family permease, partial [Prevotella sp.]|nr:LptF/LptG family permease [Prevotella sp.]
SLNHQYDSVGRVFYIDAKRTHYYQRPIEKKDSLKAVKAAMAKTCNYDSIYNKLTTEKKQRAVSSALGRVQNEMNDLEFKSMLTSDGDRLIRQHRIEGIAKFTLALSCLLFFFIGAPLGAIIRKGGIGVPVIISVLVYIVYYILDNTGYRMARGGMWAVWFGKSISTAVLAPLAAFVTYKATNDSVVFNMDLYRNLFMKLLGLRLKRHVYAKEVIINDPDYTNDAITLAKINEEVTGYAHQHKLYKLPNFIHVFFRYEPDNEIERINTDMEHTIEDLTNTKDRMILSLLNKYPIVSVKSHTRPFEKQWLNVVAGLLIPINVFIYIRMWFFRLRLLRDLKTIKETNTEIINRIHQMQ